MTIHEILLLLQNRGSKLRTPYPAPMEGMPPFTYVCTLSDTAATADDLEAIPFECPPDLYEFWKQTRTAQLFLDHEYGQWGLHIHSPIDSVTVTERFKAERQADAHLGDLVIGEFIGDSDLLVIRCDVSAVDFGSAIVATALDPRSDWYKVAPSFAGFLSVYVKNAGDKYWLGIH